MTNLMDLIHQAGFQGQSANTMYAIVMAESGGNALAHNTNAGTGDNSYGLAQINMLGSMGPERLKEFNLPNNDALFNPLTNLRVAYQMSGGGTKWTDWSTFKNGDYLKYLGGPFNAQVSNANAVPPSSPSGASAGFTTAPASNNPITDLAGSMTRVFGGPLVYMADFFKDITWIFHLGHFYRAMLFIFGSVAVALGFGMVVFGAGKNRPV